MFLPSAEGSSTRVTGEKQQELDEKALADLFQYVRSFSIAGGGSADAPSFLVLTGNLGLDPCPSAQAEGPAAKHSGPPKAPPKQPAAAPDKAGLNQADVAVICTDVNPDRRKNQIQRLVKALGSSPLRDVYLVAGSADVAHEDPGAQALNYFSQLIDEVQSALAAGKSGVRLHNLMRCYAADGAPLSSCYADIAGSPYRLIGFPSYSLRNEAATSDKDSREGEQFEIFRKLLEQAQQADRKALIVTSIPEIDDPFVLAQDRYAGKAPPKANDLPKAADKDQNNPRSPWSTWNVSRKLLDGWRDVLVSDSVAGVLAGHLRDSHKEIYRQPYAWSGLNDHRLGFRKLFLAPPLAVVGQDVSPIQARGFSWVHAYADRVVPALYWYHAETGAFEPDRPAVLPSPRPQRAFSLFSPWQFLTTLWELDQADSALIRWAVLLIAFMAGFLTVVHIWQLPAVDNPLADPKAKEQKDKDSGQAGSAQDSSPFTSKFGKTVVAGLGGLVFAEIAKTLGSQQPAAETRWFYIVWFILFFFFWLIALNLVRAVTEAFRARVAIPQQPILLTLLRPPARLEGAGRFKRLWVWLACCLTWVLYAVVFLVHSVLRFIYWLLPPPSVPVITFLDTFVNLIQGKNQTATRVFADMIVNQHRNDLRVAESIRRELNEFMNDAVERLNPKATPPSASGSTAAADRRSRVRVNISVLSADQSHMFYICKASASPRRTFPKRSVAWVSAFTGEPLWYTSAYKEGKSIPKDIVLYQNDSQLIEGEGPLMLFEHYQDRRDDYYAFILFPLPWPPRREVNPDFVRGAVHISFSVEGDIESIWKLPGKPTAQQNQSELPYPTHKPVLSEWCTDDQVTRTISAYLVVLSELLSGFNEVIYKNYIEPTQTR